MYNAFSPSIRIGIDVISTDCLGSHTRAGLCCKSRNEFMHYFNTVTKSGDLHRYLSLQTAKCSQLAVVDKNLFLFVSPSIYGGFAAYCMGWPHPLPAFQCCTQKLGRPDDEAIIIVRADKFGTAIAECSCEQVYTMLGYNTYNHILFYITINSTPLFVHHLPGGTVILMMTCTSTFQR